MAEVDPMNLLPLNIKAILQRKSSRDPSSRFTSKLHILLSFVASNPDLENKIGCVWVTDDEFRINKKALVNVMGIKINTLNVNLHALGFNQQKHNKDGWTLWKRPGFTRNSIEMDEAIQTQMALPKPNGFRLTFTLGKVSQGVFDNFCAICQKIWSDLTQLDDQPVNTSLFIQKAAQRFKQVEQPLDNARDVLKAIIAPSSSHQDVIHYSQFAKFMAMFGPEETIMLKIASLLGCSNNTGQWLAFEPVGQNIPLCGTFDENEPNRLVLRNRSTVTCIWNAPLAPASQNYVIDEYNKVYPSWDDYFRNNPIEYQMVPDSYMNTF
ncbi:39 kDa initiator binding protein [Tritrichomonas foetus]|uniref:39 kDa initiator binding protein n=1 Tax=Tritrichomonas foetus TaxID=1144522 RepID=A0A1J4K5T6_9EUKA|nr:39 kDa initiator binding protein [Tritrichomonas foetus]|eukprot:OHT06240.1 39 kDa initiator binding protein [Tritrichomonas foetus]